MSEKTILGIGSRVRHPAFGDGVVIRLHKAAYDVSFMLYGIKQVGKDYDKWEIVEAVQAEESVSFTEAERSLIKILRAFSDITEDVPLGQRWQGGLMILKPEDESLKPKEIPIEAFFHKIVMLRERLRVLEQRINNNDKLDDEEKINLQQYITRIYGSLTTFNMLFRDKSDYFIGEKSR
ncbi:MAG: hypothetical protein KDC66_06695 [Phaeodactylibacter sp.]|nr:hypothetical protein [Phaeodactylibacter sp.]MCB9275934.1 hypothetical protein [Lewinellaceae bacterium]